MTSVSPSQMMHPGGLQEIIPIYIVEPSIQQDTTHYYSQQEYILLTTRPPSILLLERQVDSRQEYYRVDLQVNS